MYKEVKDLKWHLEHDFVDIIVLTRTGRPYFNLNSGSDLNDIGGSFFISNLSSLYSIVNFKRLHRNVGFK